MNNAQTLHHCGGTEYGVQEVVFCVVRVALFGGKHPEQRQSPPGNVQDSAM